MDVTTAQEISSSIQEDNTATGRIT